jgi:hypothetical protein
VTETFGDLDLTTASLINFGTGTVSSPNFGTYTGGGFELNANSLLIGNVPPLKTDLTGTINNASLFAFDNGFASIWNSGMGTLLWALRPKPGPGRRQRQPTGILFTSNFRHGSGAAQDGPGHPAAGREDFTYTLFHGSRR